MKTSRARNRVTLPRALSKLGYASRTQAFVFIDEGRVTVNGKAERNPHRWINLESDRISVDNETVSKKEFRYLLVHKPVGVTTTHSDELGNPTIFDLIGDDAKGLSAAGRLDKDTSGLLLLTNDHQLANALTDPDSGVTKTYRATLDRQFEPADHDAFERGVMIRVDGEDYRTKPSKLHRRSPATLELSISEGKNRQVRKMFQALGYNVVRLERLSIGPLHLGSLKEKESRQLEKTELQSLRKSLLL